MRRQPLGFAVIIVLLASTTFAQAPPPDNDRVPPVVRFAGTLAVAAGRVQVTFGLYTEQAGGEPLWSESQTVSVDESGRYTAVVGSAQALPAALFVSGEARWLEVAVEGGAPLPRVMLVSVPYTLKAADADTIGGRPLSAFVLAGDRTGVGADGLTYVDARVIASGLGSGANGPPSPLGGFGVAGPHSPLGGFGVAGPTSPLGGFGVAGGAGSPNYIGLFSDATTLVNSVMYQSGTSIGVNTTAPAAALHVAAVTTSGPAAYVDSFANGVLGTLPMLYRSARGTPAAPSAVQANDILGGLAVRGYGTTGWSSGRGQVMYKAAENWTDSAQGTYLQLTTTPVGTGAWAERMRITPDGKVGIGTQTPAQMLSVAGIVESTTGGFRFPDGTIQATAALASLGSAGTFIRSNGTAWLASAIQANDVPQIPASRVTGTAAVLSGGNRFSDDQTVTGTVRATAFVGDGSGLTNVAAAQIASLQAQITALQKLVDQSAAPGSAFWATGLGAAGDDSAYSVAADASGNLFVTGAFTGTINLGGGPLTSAGGSDIFLARYSSDGTHMWSKRFGGTGDDLGRDVAVDSRGNVVVTGYFAGSVDFGLGALTSAGQTDILVAKYSANGVAAWTRRFGGVILDFGFGVAVDPSDNVLLTGSFSTTADFGGGALASVGLNDVFLAKFTSEGNHAWSKSYGASGEDYGRAVATDAAGNVLLGGWFAGSVNFGLGALTSAGLADVFVLELTSAGAPAWTRRFGSSGTNHLGGLAVDLDGNVVISGEFNSSISFGGASLTSAGDYDAFLAKLTTAGTHMWSMRFGSTGSDSGGRAAVDQDGNVIAIGSFTGTASFGGASLASAGGTDVFLAKFTPDGAHAWSQRFGGTGEDRGFGVAVDTNGHIGICGDSGGTLSFGGVPIVNVGLTDGFLARIHR